MFVFIKIIINMSIYTQRGASVVAQRLKCLPAMRETWVWSMGQEVPLEKEMATHSSILAWRIPRTEEPGRLQFMGLQSQTRLSNFTFIHREGNGNPLQYSCLENTMDGGAWWATVHRISKSQPQLSDFTFTFSFIERLGFEIGTAVRGGAFRAEI